jgi:hypothetical protein
MFMSIMPPTTRDAESSKLDFVADVALTEPTLITASNGDYLDIEAGEDGEPARLTTVPVSRVRHAFRIHRLQDTRTRRWKVEVEPVPLAGAPQAEMTEAETTPPTRFAMDLAYHGCINFELSTSEPIVVAEEEATEEETTEEKATNEEATNEGFFDSDADDFFMVQEAAPSEELSFSLDMSVADLAFAESTTNFPVFTGESQKAFEYIASKLQVDPHSETVDSASLARISRSSDIPKAAWTTVMDQLQLEVHYRRLCSDYFQSFREFTQNVFIANARLVNTIGSLLDLESEQSKIIHVAVHGMFSGIAKGVGALGFPGAGVVSGALGLAFDFMLKDQGPGATELAVAYAHASDELAKRFNGIITQAQRSKVETFADWGKLQKMGESMEGNGGKNRWPGDDSALRDEAARLMEISLWKDLLKVKWHHMTASDAPGFLKDYGEENKRSYEAKNKNYCVEYKAGRGAVGFKEEDGFLITHHWLGYGSTVYTHHEPSKAMLDRLFGDRLKVSRCEVFNDSSWNLTRETFFVQNQVHMR